MEAGTVKNVTKPLTTGNSTKRKAIPIEYVERTLMVPVVVKVPKGIKKAEVDLHIGGALGFWCGKMIADSKWHMKSKKSSGWR